MTMDIMYEPVPYTMKQTYSHTPALAVVISLVAFARLCCVRSAGVVDCMCVFFYLAFYVLSFLIIIMVFPNVDTSYEFIPIKLFVLFVFTRFSSVFDSVDFCCFVSVFGCSLSLVFHWKGFSSFFSFIHQTDKFFPFISYSQQQHKMSIFCCCCLAPSNIIISFRFFSLPLLGRCVSFIVWHAYFYLLVFLVFKFMFYSTTFE